MNSKLKVLVSVVSMSFIMVGCGGGGGSSTNLDNSKLADGQNEYGYYGEEVIFGNSIAVGKWTLSGGRTPITFELETDGTLLLNTAFGMFAFSYGVSKDGVVLSQSLGKDKYEIVKTLNNDCYEVDLYSSGQVLDRVLCKR